MSNQASPTDKSLGPVVAIALSAVLIGLVAVVTRFLIFPVGQGYFNFSDTVVYFVAFTFGPWIGLIAGGVGAALADISTGAYAFFAPLTFLGHGLQGFVAGWLAKHGKGTPVQRMIVGWIGGTITMVAIYFLGEYFGAALGWGGPAAAVAELPFNLLQNIVGAVVAIPLSLLVRRAYPPLARYTEGS